MSTFAQVINNCALNVIVGDDVDSARAQHFVEGYDGGHPDVEWTAVSDTDVSGKALLSGAVTADNGATYTNPDSSAKPINANNPYFPKKLLTGGQFIGLLMATLGMTKWNRLVNDTNFAGILSFLNAEGTIVNTDDKQGQFLRLVGYLTTTNAADNQPLMSTQDVQTVMAGWQAP